MKMRKTISILLVLSFVLSMGTFTVAAEKETDSDCVLVETITALAEDFGIRYYGTLNEEKAALFLADQFRKYAPSFEVETLKAPLKYPGGYLYLNSRATPAVIEFPGDNPWIMGRAMPSNANFASTALGDFSGTFYDFGNFADLSLPDGLTGGNIYGALRFDNAATLANINAVIAAIDTKYGGAVKLTGLIISRSDRTAAVLTGSNAGIPVYKGIPANIANTPVSIVGLTLSCLEKAVTTLNTDGLKDVYWFEPSFANATYAVKKAPTDDPDLVIVVSSHLDAVWGAKGVNDNASGLSLLVEVARRLDKVDLGNVELIFTASGGHEYGDFDASIFLAERLEEQGKISKGTLVGDRWQWLGAPGLGVNLNADMIAPALNAVTGTGVPLDVVTIINRNMNYNLASYLLTDESASVSKPAGLEGYVKNVQSISASTASDFLMFQYFGLDAASIQGTLENAWHTSADNLLENYSYDRHLYATNLMERAILKAVDQELTKRAKFYINEAEETITLLNADQIFKTWHTLRGEFCGVPFEFTPAIDAVDITLPADPADYAVTNIVALGVGINDLNAGTTAPFTTRLVSEFITYLPPSVYASVKTLPDANVHDKIQYELALRDAVNVLAVDFEFEVDGAMLSADSFEGLNGFAAIESVQWTDNGDGTWKGAVRFGYTPPEDEFGFTATPYTDIAKIVFDSTGLFGEADLKITKLQITGFDEAIGEVVFYNVIIEAGTATTLVGNKYDLNKDGKVDLLDLGIMLLYVGYNEDDPEWDTLVKIFDKKGAGITPKDCDVNGDGEVDMADLVELLVNFD